MPNEIWTDEQLKAIKMRGNDILVAAAAGSGKTAVLTERILRMITEDGIDIDRLLVLTFTSAAAAEMRERISGAIIKKIEESGGSPRLYRQLMLINRADITTIHSFCMKIVRNNFSAAEVDPNFRIMNNSETYILKNQVMEELFEELYESGDNKWFLSLVESFCGDTDDLELRQLVLKIFELSFSGPFPEKWLSECAEAYNIPHGTTFDETLWALHIRDEIPAVSGYLKNCVDEMERLLFLEGAPVLYRKVLAEEKYLTEGIFSAVKGGFDETVKFLEGVKFMRLPPKDKGSDDEIARRFKDLREIVKAEFKRIQETYFALSGEENIEILRKIYPMASDLCRLTKMFSDLYALRKKERKTAEFTDLEHWCLKVLMNEDGTPTETALRMQERYAEILTDEYQDTNPIQECILNLVSKKDSGAKNRFMVGDIKQSIYRFRLASPEIFINKYEDFKNGGEGVKIDLFSNFRSRKYILDCINFIFFRIMTKEFGEIEYDENAALHGGGYFPEYTGSGSIGKSAEVCIICGENAESDSEDEEDLTAVQYEARFAAKRIKKLIDEKFEIFDNKINGYRRLKLGDIVILLRSVSSAAGIFASELIRQGVDAYSEKSESFFDSVEIMTVISFLRVIDNPYQDIPVLSVLKSPAYRLDGNRLFEISSKGQGDTFYEKILDYAQNEEGAYLKKFIADIEKWKAAAKFAPSDTVIQQVYRDTGYFDYVGAEKNGSIKQGKLKALINMASEFEKNSFMGLFMFLRYIDKIRDSGMAQEGQAVSGESDNIVRIMSIHKSKGLEFPVVFISGLGKKFYTKDLSGVLRHNGLGLGLPLIDAENRVKYTSVAQKVMQRRLLAEKAAEELRILYVAMTRAKEKLILTGHVKSIEKSAVKWGITGNTKGPVSSYSLLEGKSFFDWIMPALAVHKNAGVLREFYSSDGYVSKDSSPWEIKLVSESELSSKAGNMQDKSGEKHDETTFDAQYIQDIFLWKYPFENDSRIPSCISIAEIKKKYMEYIGEEGEEMVYPSGGSLKRLPGKAGLSAAEKGQAYHCLMEHIDFKRKYDEASLGEYIAILAGNGILTDEEAESIDKKKILRFFDSDLGKRAARAEILKKEASFAMELTPAEIYMDDEFGNSRDGTLVHGIIDCYFYEGDEIVLFDYKTDYSERGKEEKLTEKYRVQLTVYKRALEAATGKKVKDVYIYSFFADKELKIFL